MLLNLNNYDASEVDYKFFLMPDGSPHSSFHPELLESSVTKIICSITSMHDIGKLAVIVDALSRIKSGTREGWTLTIPYMIGGRQDRHEPGKPVTADVICNLLLSILEGHSCGQIQFLHPHSDAIQHFIGPRFVELDHTKYVDQAIKDFRPDFLIIPDAGAAKNAAKYDKFSLPQVQCLKKRDPETGKLSGFRVADEIPSGRAMIVDDLLDKCGTFLGLAKLFPNNDIALYGTHGILGVDQARAKEISNTFKQIYTTNSYRYAGIPVQLDGKLPWVLMDI